LLIGYFAKEIFKNRIDKRKIVYYTQKVCKANRTSKPFYSAKNCKKAFYNKEKLHEKL